jgi:hypothetical protein
MTAEELRAIMEYIRERVRLETLEAETPVVVAFHEPTEAEMVEAGLNPEGARRILAVPWWREMVTDIVETPEMCDPDDPPQQILEYARDVVSEYIRKRFPLE